MVGVATRRVDNRETAAAWLRARWVMVPLLVKKLRLKTKLTINLMLIFYLVYAQSGFVCSSYSFLFSRSNPAMLSQASSGMRPR